ncbi:MAG: reverse transcriptase-like protein [Candidatus Electrothrix sp. AR4]|nr:reverse transcriptase-like protein [Candidatus Electrothrix sp. AR4]
MQQQELFTQSVAVSCTLFTDGASRGNPGEAGAGSILLDADGEELAARSLYLGQCTNNVAEYRALILGLQSALELKCGRLEIFLDSQLIVRQIQGQYKVKNATLKPLFEEVKELLARVDNWSIAHVPRKENKRADELANRGIDERVK